ncbi:P-loop containing nucleoside triphosphate hydrolase protein, partial [Cadophora sp. DSE1049]
IIFRRASTISIKVSIIPGPDRSRREVERLRGYVKDGLVALAANEFLEILTEVCSGRSLETGQSTFSDDLLSIELCGPDKQNLSIIDIPGIFRTPTEGVTTEDDMALVRRIMHRHIQDERTIILAVIPSNTDVATQEILTIAKEVDPKGIRTLGVLTKPDLIDNGGEENVMSLVEGKRNPLRLGYCIVRNRGQSELLSDSVARRRREKDFFSTEPWSRLDGDRVGTPALQKRLQDLLVSITRREFPKVQTQIVQQLSSCRKGLESLGADRESTDQQRQF